MKVIEKPVPKVRGQGRPRDQELEQKVYQSVIEIYLVSGWAGLTLEAVARRAKVGKAAIYLRWKDKDELILHVLSQAVLVLPKIDTGSFSGDLLELAQQIFEFYLTPQGRMAFNTLIEGEKKLKLHESYQARVVKPALERVSLILRQARKRSELKCEVDETLVIDTLSGAILAFVLNTGLAQEARLRQGFELYRRQLVELLLTGIQTA